MKQNIFIYIFFSLLFTGCTIAKPVNYSFQDNKNTLHPQFLIYHHSETTSKLYFQILTEEILYSRVNVSEKFSSKIKLQFVAYNESHKEIIDSGSFIISDKYLKHKKLKIDTNFSFLFPMSKTGFIDLNVLDINRNREFYKTIRIDKLNDFNRQFFLIKDSSNQLLYNDFFFKGQSILIQSEYNNNSLFAKKINNSFPLSPPPFSKSYQPIFKSNNSVCSELNFNSQKLISFTLPDEGFVFFQLDTLNNQGFTLFNFHEGYPNLIKDKHLISPLRYLTTKEEFVSLVSSSDSKLAVDKYWLSKASSKERARNLIRMYYSRVELANKLFSCHLEGWKTDRGLISIIFGPPSYVTNNRNSETWIYGDENNINSLKFIFENKMNPFSSNDFKLKRNYAYKNPWYRAVDSWRNGKVYLLK